MDELLESACFALLLAALADGLAFELLQLPCDLLDLARLDRRTACTTSWALRRGLECCKALLTGANRWRWCAAATLEAII